MKKNLFILGFVLLALVLSSCGSNAIWNHTVPDGQTCGYLNSHTHTNKTNGEEKLTITAKNQGDCTLVVKVNRKEVLHLMGKGESGSTSVTVAKGKEAFMQVTCTGPEEDKCAGNVKAFVN